MSFMSDADFVAHALCDYLRPLLPAADINMISSDMGAGEPYAAISWALEAAIEDQVAIPPVFVENILALPEPGAFNDEPFVTMVARLPRWSLVA